MKTKIDKGLVDRMCTDLKAIGFDPIAKEVHAGYSFSTPRKYPYVSLLFEDGETKDLFSAYYAESGEIVAEFIG